MAEAHAVPATVLPHGTEDRRAWITTDRPGELVTLSRPADGLELMSVKGSDRRWCDVHTCYVVAFIDDGQPGVEAMWKHRARTYTTTSGGFFLFTPNSEHRTLAVRGLGNFSVVRLSPDLLLSAQETLKCRGKLTFDDPARRDDIAFAALKRFVGAVATAESELAVECAQAEAVSAILTRLGSCEPVALSDGLCHSGVRAVRSFLKTNLTERTSLAELSSLARLTPFGLCQAFRARVGMSPGQYWHLCRVSVGRGWLQRGASAKDVAHDLGFADEAHFSRIFKRFYGTPPGRWARMSLANDRGVVAR